MLILSTRESINKIWFSFINANINQNQIFHYQLYLVLNINNDKFISILPIQIIKEESYLDG